MANTTLASKLTFSFSSASRNSMYESSPLCVVAYIVMAYIVMAYVVMAMYESSPLCVDTRM